MFNESNLNNFFLNYALRLCIFCYCNFLTQSKMFRIKKTNNLKYTNLTHNDFNDDINIRLL